MQGGSNADVVLADSYLKNITENISWPTAYAAVLSDAEEEPEDWSIEGRGNLESYHRLGYIPWNDEDKNGTGPASRTVSRTLEYAYDDYCISVLARGRGDRVDEEKYLFRSTGWRNLWNPHQKDMVRDGRGYYVKSRFTGFMQPRLLNGSFRFQSPRLCSPIHEPHLCYFDTAYDTYEGSPWLYTFYVPQDMAGLIEVLGGPGPFIERLHYFHESGIIYMGNEQSFLPTFQFHYGGRPGLSSYWAHRYVPSIFNHSINGIPGNDDCAMGAFTAFIYMGFFPVAGQDVYLLIPPLFPEVRIRARNGKQAIIRNINFDPTGKEKIYIQSATLNGKPYTRSWITHSFFMEGGLLELVLGSGESAAWGTAPEDLPPSTSSHPDERVRAIANGTVRYLPDLVYEGPPPSSDGDAPQSYPWPPPVPENSPDYDPAGQPPPQQVPMAQPPDSSAGGGGVSGGGGIGSSNGSTPAPIEQNLPPVKLPTRPHSSNVTPSSSKSDAESSGSGLGVGEQVPDPLPLSHENPGPRELAEIRAQAHRAGVESKNRAASQQRGGMGSQGPTFHRRPPVEENAAGKSHGGETALGDQGGQEKQQERQQTARLKDELKQP